MIRDRGAPFIGRERELAQLRERFATGPWVTLLGPGGMGKTRLASRFAAEAREGGREVCFVELGSSEDASRALAQIARALRAELAEGGSEAASSAIANRVACFASLLLVLDDVEVIAAELAPHVAEWLSRSAGLQVLVTSRRALGADREQVLALEPMRVEDAIELFAARARAVREVSLDEGLAKTIVESIDRMPLAIELAASRLRVLSLPELAHRLAEPLVVLRSGAEGRHGSIRRAVQGSLDLLSDSERRLFALASTLRDGFTFDDAEAALAGHFSAEALLDGLAALVQTSLIRVAVDDAACSRYSFFATIREVAAELDEPARAEVRLRASRHFARREGPVLEVELDNHVHAHRAAVEAAIASRSMERADDAIALLERIEGHLSITGRSALRETLGDGTLVALEVAGAPASARARAHLGRGLARRELGKTAAAREDFLAALELGASDDGLRAAASIRLAALDDVASDTAAARARLEEALRWLERSADDATRRAREAEAGLHLGHALRREGRLGEARDALQASIVRYRELGDDPGLAAALYELAVVEIFARTPQADAVVDEGLGVARRSGARRMEGTLLMARGCVLHERGELDAARAHHAEAASLFGGLGDPHREASALFYLATTYVEARRIDDALGLLARARALASNVGSPRYESLVEAVASSALAIGGRHVEAGAAIALARRHAARVPDEPALCATVTVHARLVAWLAGDESAALAESEREVAKSSNDDSRFALRLLQSVVRGDRPDPLDVLVVADDGAWFRAPGVETRVALPTRSPLRRLLACLVAHRLESPGRAVSVDGLLAAGWPDEKMRAESALNRLYVAIATLRKRGLGDVVESAGGGYLVSPAVPVEREDAAVEGDAAAIKVD